MSILSQTSHRPWPLPASPWIMKQTWSKLLFAHWPIPVEKLMPLIPKGMQLDTFEGQAWIAVVPFRMRYQLRLMPFAIDFDELNVRTYVVVNGKPGVCFFSLDASDLITVLGARVSYQLPYYYSKMKSTVNSETSQVTYACERYFSGASPAVFDGCYAPTSNVYLAKPGTLEHWLTERYCLYTLNHKNDVCSADVHHVPWPLQTAEASINTNTMVEVTGLELPKIPPLLHYSESIDVLIWPPKKTELH